MTTRDRATGDTARDRATGDTARDRATGDTARDDHPRRRTPRRAIRHATTLSYPMMSGDVPAPFFLVLCLVASRILSGGAAVRWCGGPVVLMMFDDVRLCPVMPGYVRLCSVMFDCSMISDDVRFSPMIRGDARSLRLPGRFGIHMSGLRAAQRLRLAAPPNEAR